MRVRSVILLLLCPVFGLAAITYECYTPESQLSIAGAEGNQGWIREILADGADPNEQDARGWTALMFASTMGHGPAVEALLSGGATIDQTDEHGNTALIHAANTGPPWLCEPYGEADSHEAIYETVLLLMRAGADVNVRGHYDATALYYAAFGGHAQIAQILIDAGADVDAQDAFGFSPLIKAAAGFMSVATSRHVDTVQVLLAAGANVDATTNDFWTSLMFAARGVFAGAGANAELVETLLEAGADRTARNRDGDTAFDIAVTRGNTAVAEMLRE